MTEREKVLIALRERQENPPKKIDNGSLYAGSPMYFYCKLCQAEIVLPEDFICAVPQLCNDCNFIKDKGFVKVKEWFDD